MIPFEKTKQYFNSITISVGYNSSVELIAKSDLSLFPLEGKTKDFLGSGMVLLSLMVISGQLPQIDSFNISFDSGGLWKVFRKGDLHIFVLQSPQSPQPYSVVKIDFQARQGEVYLTDTTNHPIYPFGYPLDEVIFSKLLADRASVIVHACGVSYNGIGILFPGHSGAGKSTLSTLLSHYPGLKILSDDRVVLGIRNDGVYISGTPWLGSAGFALPESAPLRRILFLQHDSTNRLETVNAIDATTQLLGLSVLPYWDDSSVEKAIEAAARAVEQVPAARFGFVPDASAVECLLHAIDFDQR
jgi:hypothetical protein